MLLFILCFVFVTVIKSSKSPLFFYLVYFINVTQIGSILTLLPYLPSSSLIFIVQAFPFPVDAASISNFGVLTSCVGMVVVVVHTTDGVYNVQLLFTGILMSDKKPQLYFKTESYQMVFL